VAALLSSLTDEGEELFKELIRGVSNKEKKMMMMKKSNNDEESSESKNKNDEKKKTKNKDKKEPLSIFDRLGKLVKMMMRVVAALVMQLALTPVLMAK
jgi:lipopolysaccharide/colanic/teichoic acid biosynthesis glycosyltransferase